MIWGILIIYHTSYIPTLFFLLFLIASFRNLIDQLILIFPPNNFLIIVYTVGFLMIFKAFSDEAVNSMVEKKWQFWNFNLTSDLWEAPRQRKQRKEETEIRKAKILFYVSNFWNLTICFPFQKQTIRTLWQGKYSLQIKEPSLGKTVMWR